MPQLSTVTVNNFSDTPVPYYPAGINSQTGVATLLGVGAYYDARPKITFSSTPPTNKATKFKTMVRLVLPHMDSVDASRKVDESIIEIRVNVSKSATLANRRDIRVLASNLLLDDSVANAIDAQEGIW